MSGECKIYYQDDISFTVKYSGRRTIGISIRPDSSVIVRAPCLTPEKTIIRIVRQKEEWIKKHLSRLEKSGKRQREESYVNGAKQLFRGKECLLKVTRSAVNHIRFSDACIEIGLPEPGNKEAVKRLLYKGYKKEAMMILPEMLKSIMIKYGNERFRPAGLVIRKMKRRWGSCSDKGVITLSTELVKLPDNYIEYIIVHELCHLIHHDHSKKYYNLLSSLIPDWKNQRNNLREYAIR